MSNAVPSPVILSANGAWRREPPRPVEHRQAGYEQKFDYLTLFYDAYHAGDRIVFHGPPLLNLAPLVTSATLTALPLNLPCRFEVISTWPAVLFVNAPPGTKQILLTSQAGRFFIQPQPDEADVFADRRVLVAINRNNRLQWIEDWVRFHVVNHGCDAVLLYDNHSTLYPLPELIERLAAIEGLKAHRTAYWPFTFGPDAGPAKLWDSNYCQGGMLTDARWRFLRLAKSVLHVDIDELVVHDRGLSVFAAAEQSPDGYCGFNGHWIENTRASSVKIEAIRHCHYCYRQRDDLVDYPPKWAVVPAKCAANQNWGIHRISGKYDESRIDPNFKFRHFRAISTSWKYARNEPIAFDPNKYVVDEVLREAFRRGGMSCET